MSHDVPSARPDRSTVLRELEAIIRAPAPAVFARLVELVQPTDRYSSIGVFPSRQLVVVEGDWWYRGEYRVIAASGGGTVVTHSIVNVAQRGRALVWITARKTVKGAPAEFARLVNGLRIDVGG